tara:strand:+ start:1081 stop:1305 length:225 start_codon:yes stop_codon:yes gene_type:complete
VPHKALIRRNTTGVSLNLISAKKASSALAVTIFVNQNSGAASFIAPGVLNTDDLERALVEIGAVANDCCDVVPK